MMKNLKIIYILWLRQLKRYVRSKSRMIGSLGQPLLFLVALGFGFGPIYAKAGGGNYMQFLAPGVMCMSILFTSVFSGIEIIWDRQFGFLKETLVAPVPRIYIMIGRTLGGATVATIQGLVVFVLTFFVGFRPISIGMLPLALLSMFLIALVFTALGTAIGSALDDMQGFQIIINFLVMPLFFLSGALFPIDNLPSAIGIITKLDPLSYGVDALRGTLSGVSQFGIGFDLAIISILVVIIMSIGAKMFSKIEI